MAKMETLTVDLPVEVMAKVRIAVEDGEYSSDSDVVSDAMLAWISRRDAEVEDIEWLRQAVKEADEHPGPGVPMEEVMDRLEAKYKALYAAQVVAK